MTRKGLPGGCTRPAGTAFDKLMPGSPAIPNDKKRFAKVANHVLPVLFLSHALMPKATNNRRALGVVFLIMFIDLMGFSIIFPLFPAMLDYYLPEEGGDGLLGNLVSWLSNLSAREGDQRFLVAVLFGGILGSLYSLLQFVFSPIWGKLSDKFGRRNVLLLTQSCTALGYLLWIFAGEFWLLVLSRTLAGVMSGNIAVATAAISDITDQQGRAKGMAVVGIAFALGFLLGPAIGGLAAQWDWTACGRGLEAYGINPFSAPAAIAFILALLNVIWIRYGFKETLKPEDREAALARDKAEGNRLAALFHLKTPDIRRACWVNFLFTLSFAGMEFTLTFLAVERFAYSTLDNGLMFLFIGFWLIIAQGVFVRRLAPTLGERKLSLGGIFSAMLAFAMIAAIADQTVFFVALAFFSIGAGLVFPSLAALVSLYADPSEQGRYLGIYRSAGALARAFGPLLAALVYFHFGGGISYTFGTVLLILPLLLALKMRQPAKE